MIPINLIGHKYGRLTVTGYAGITLRGQKRKQRYNLWECKCDCGGQTFATTSDLRSGNTKSCGCLNKERITKHGKSKTRLYTIYGSMKSRCYCPNNTHYKDYGGRGIRICDEWLKDFTAFYDWSKNNGYSDNFSIDRIDNNAGYSPSNCRWVSKKAQGNNRRTNKHIEYEGKLYTISELADKTGIHKSTLAYRIKQGLKGKSLIYGKEVKQ